MDSPDRGAPTGMAAGSSLKLRLVVPLWLLLIAIGGTLLWRFETRPGPSVGPAYRWPATSQLATQSNRPTLVIFAHPQCPCTRATLSELDRVLARVGDRVETHVVFVRPGGVAAGWEASDLWTAAKAIPGVQVEVDEHGAEAKRFGAVTSGHTLLYSDGQLQFSGGITGARGHAGDNEGEDALVAFLTTGRSNRTSTPVFGCSLLNDASLPGE